MIEKTSSPGTSPRHRARRLRIIGVSVLTLGIVAAGLVYWLGTRNGNLNNDPAMLGFNRAAQRQMGQLYGKSGLLIDQWADDLKQPGTQATLIAVTSVLVAAGCFYFARLGETDNEPR